MCTYLVILTTVCVTLHKESSVHYSYTQYIKYKCNWNNSFGTECLLFILNQFMVILTENFHKLAWKKKDIASALAMHSWYHCIDFSYSWSDGHFCYFRSHTDECSFPHTMWRNLLCIAYLFRPLLLFSTFVAIAFHKERFCCRLYAIIDAYI